MSCFQCNKKADYILKNFWLGMSFMPAVSACRECKERIEKSVSKMTAELIIYPANGGK